MGVWKGPEQGRKRHEGSGRGNSWGLRALGPSGFISLGSGPELGGPEATPHAFFMT